MSPFGDPGVTRAILGNVPGWLAAAFYLAALAAGLAAAAGFARRTARIRRGRPEPADGGGDRGRRRWPARAAAVARYLLFHRELRRDRHAGLAHLLTFHGFVVLFIGTCLVFLEHQTPLHFFYGWFYRVASLAIDLGGVALLVGLGLFLWRRHAPAAGGRDRLLHGWWVATLAWLLLAIGVTGFVLEAARIARDLPAFERWSVAGYALARGLRAAGLAGDAALPWHRGLWVAHALLSVAFFALLPWRFVGHAVYGAASWATRAGGPPGALRPPLGAAPGARTWTDFGRRDLLQAEACTTCGRCNAVCPALAAGKPLRPREVVLGLREAMLRADRPDAGVLVERVPDAVLWSCTTCGACNDACPVGIEVFDKLVELRRGRVEGGDVPAAAARVFDGLLRHANPFERRGADRLAWAAGLDVPVAREGEPVELLYWVGCAGSFDPDGQGVSRAMVKLLADLGVPYRVLGARERCTGDPARRMGEEGLFRELARGNVDLLAAHGVRRVLTHCPHCYNALRNEYPALGARFDVEHHSQFLARMIAQGRLAQPAAPAAGDGGGGRPITFHDPCYLARGNGEVRAPRAALAALSRELVEMPRHGAGTFCCGAGGGAMWLDVPGRERVESIRIREALATGAGTVATGCPFCKSMLQASAEGLATAGALRVRDLAELLAEARGL